MSHSTPRRRSPVLAYCLCGAELRRRRAGRRADALRAPPLHRRATDPARLDLEHLPRRLQRPNVEPGGRLGALGGVHRCRLQGQVRDPDARRIPDPRPAAQQPHQLGARGRQLRRPARRLLATGTAARSSCSAGAASPAATSFSKATPRHLRAAASTTGLRASSSPAAPGSCAPSPTFRGDCRSYAPVRYAELGSSLAREVSSASPGPAAARCPVVISPGHPLPAEGLARAILYSERAGRREPRPLRTGERSRTIQFQRPRRVDGRRVERTWVACRDTYFRGDCRIFRPGPLRRQRGEELPAPGVVDPARGGGVVAQPPPATPPRSASVELFSDADFRGDRVAVDGPMTDLDALQLQRSHRVGDRPRRHLGDLQRRAGFGGSCALFKPGNYPRIGGLARHVSSVRRVQ